MANEITLSLALSVNKPSVMSAAVARSLTALLRNMNGNNYIEGVFSVPTSATAIPVGGVSSPYYGFFYNTDTTNYLQLQNGVSGAVFARLKAGDVAIVPLDQAISLYGISNTAACLMEYLILSQ